MEPQAAQPGARKKILVLGDWVVDDYWIMGVHRSPTASRTGRAHYRSLHPPGACVRALCGAGETASVLHDAAPTRFSGFDIVGIGIWHQDDDAAVTQLIDDPTKSGLNPYRLSWARPRNRSCKMINLAGVLLRFLDEKGEFKALSRHIPHDGDYKGIATSRTIRIFQNTGTRIKLLERIDWELPAPFNQQEGVHAWFPDPALYEHQEESSRNAVKQLQENLEEELHAQLPRSDREGICAVVIKDLGKGCVSSTTVRLLAKMFDRVPWYISSKTWQPKWFRIAPPGWVRLVMVPQVAARTATHQEAVKRWLTRSGLPTRDAITCIDELRKTFGDKPEDKRILITVLPEKQQALFVGPFEGDDDCHVQCRTEPADLDFEVAMASVLLPALVSHLLEDEKEPRPANHEARGRNPGSPSTDQDGRPAEKVCVSAEKIWAAASFTDEWMEEEVRRIKATEDQGAKRSNAKKADPPARLKLDLSKSSPRRGLWQSLQWDVQRDQWNTALNNMGILEQQQDEPTIELFRAMTVLDGFVCLVSHKQDVVQRLLREVRRFVEAWKRSHVTELSPVSVLLTASPGSGKSALIEALVKSEKLASYTINLAQLVGRSAVIDEFDTIATLQAQNREAPLLVFVDEINSMLNSQHVYDLFLSAMQNGEYVRGGNRFRLDPCIWIFAGTAKPDDDPATKGKDFQSRLTVAPMSLDPPDYGASEHRLEVDAEIRLERVYLGVAILAMRFKDVRRVTRKILRLFHSLPIQCTVRDLVKLISGFENIQLGEVHSGNVPRDGFSQIEGIVGFDFGEWSQHVEEGFVTVEAR